MNHFISLQDAIVMTTRYRNRKELLLLPAYQDKNINPLSETFDRSSIDVLLSQAGCTGLRIYYGMTDDDQIHAIIVCVDAANGDLLPDANGNISNTTSPDTGHQILELGIRCPTNCPPSSLLNS